MGKKGIQEPEFSLKCPVALMGSSYCYEISGNRTGLHWDALDEDISVEGLLMGIGDRT
jgi:hypothetical protein